MRRACIEALEPTGDIRCLPGEILAQCFVWLPFRDRIAASHVSRLWRSISLTHPAVWADIDVSGYYRIGNYLLRMAIARTGTHPVTIYRSFAPDPECIVERCLAEHLHHVQSIRGAIPRDSVPLQSPAPLLEELALIGYHINIPVDFLGGQPARLRTLHLSTATFPPVCPVLHSVTTLILSCPRFRAREDVATYSRIFNLCPQLKSLTLLDLDLLYPESIPQGAVPQTLEKLFLNTRQEGYDLTQHFMDWRTDSLRDVALEQIESLTPQRFAQFVEGFNSIHVGINHARWLARITARDAADRTHTITFGHSAESRSDVSDMILTAKDALRRLENLEVSLNVLPVFLHILSAFPELTRIGIRVSIVALPKGDSVHPFQKTLIPAVLGLKSACPSLVEIVLDLVCPNPHCPPTPHDAQHLASRIFQSSTSGALPHTLGIKGCTSDVYGAVDFDAPVEPLFELSFQCP